MRKKRYVSILLAMVLVLSMAVPVLTTVSAQGASVKKAKVSTTAATKKIKNYKRSAKKIRSDLKRTKLAGTYAGRRTQFYKFVNRINSLENKLERLEDNWEMRYKTGKTSRFKYKTIEQKVERVENYLDGLEDYLDRKFKYEFND